MMQCPCPGAPTLLCDCLSIQYPVELPVPERNNFGERNRKEKKVMGHILHMLDLVLQPPLLENLLGVLFASCQPLRVDSSPRVK